MKCAGCGQENAEGQRFCRYCGKLLGSGAAASGDAGAAASGMVNTAGTTGAAASGMVNEAGVMGAAASGMVNGAASNTATADRESGAEESAASGVLHLTIYSASRDEVLSDASVSVRGNDGYEAELHGGAIDLDGLPAGSYSVSASADGHNAREVEFTIDAGEELTRTLALAPEIVSADDACVLLVWDGEQDLDLCGFNADIQEYVNCGHIKDSVESIILFGDHGADKGFELLYIHDISYEVVKSIYVTEVSPARAGESSAMERDGVHVYLYDKNGERFSLTADASRDAALWRPFYIYAGEVYPEEEYISDTSELAWLSFDEADQIVERDDVAASETASAGGTGSVGGTASGGTSSAGGAGSAGGTASGGASSSGGAASSSDTGWKQAYLDFLNTPAQWFEYSSMDDVTERDVVGCFIYVDNDAVPELRMSATCRSDIVLTYHNGRLDVLWGYEDRWEDKMYLYERSNGVDSYIPYSGRLLWYVNGDSGASETIYSVSASGFRLGKSGFLSYTSSFGSSWDEATVSDYEAYIELQQRDYDRSQAVAVWTIEKMSYDELIAYLSR